MSNIVFSDAEVKMTWRIPLGSEESKEIPHSVCHYCRIWRSRSGGNRKDIRPAGFRLSSLVL